MPDVPLPTLVYNVSLQRVRQGDGLNTATIPVLSVNRKPTSDELKSVIEECTLSKDTPDIRVSWWRKAPLGKRAVRLSVNFGYCHGPWANWTRGDVMDGRYSLVSSPWKQTTRRSEKPGGSPRKESETGYALNWELLPMDGGGEYVVFVRVPYVTKDFTAHKQYVPFTASSAAAVTVPSSPKMVNLAGHVMPASWAKWLCSLMYAVAAVAGLLFESYGVAAVLAGISAFMYWSLNRIDSSTKIAVPIGEEEKAPPPPPPHHEYLTSRWEQFQATSKLAALSLIPNHGQETQMRELSDELHRLDALIEVLRVSGDTTIPTLPASVLAKDPDYLRIASPRM